MTFQTPLMMLVAGADRVESTSVRVAGMIAQPLIRRESNTRIRILLPMVHGLIRDEKEFS
jgi:hypothetical protein